MKKLLTVLFVIAILSACNGTDEETNSSEPVYEDIGTYDPAEETPSVYEPLEESDSTARIITIETPDCFVFTPFAPNPNLTIGGKGFTWGEYIPFVAYTVAIVTNEPLPIFDFAFLGEGISSVGQGNKTYQRLNEMFLKTASVIEVPESMLLQFTREEFNNMIFNSRVVYVSEDGRTVATNSLVHSFSEDGHSLWDVRIDVYHDGILIDSFMFEEDFLPASMWFIMHLSPHSLSNREHHFVSDWHMNEFRIYTTENMQLEYVINFDTEHWYTVEQFLHERYLLISFAKHDQILDWEYSEHHSATYLFDLHTLEMARLGSYMFAPQMSPCMRFIAFADHRYIRHGTVLGTYANNLAEMKAGFYVKNLETSQITFYSLDGYLVWNAGIEITVFAHSVIGWVSRNGIETHISISY